MKIAVKNAITLRNLYVNIFSRKTKRKKRKNYDTEYPKNYLHKQAKNVRLKSIII